MKPADRAALHALASLNLDRATLARLFAAIRRHDDATLTAALAAPPKTARKTPVRPVSSTLLADVKARLAPLLASAQEKADALGAAVSRAGNEAPPAARGLAAMVRALEQRYGADAVRAGAARLMGEIAAAAGRDSPP